MIDEALDGIDERARRAIVDALFSADAPWSILLTTHVEEIAALCDQRFRIEGGVLRPEVA